MTRAMTYIITQLQEPSSHPTCKRRPSAIRFYDQPSNLRLYLLFMQPHPFFDSSLFFFRNEWQTVSKQSSGRETKTLVGGGVKPKCYFVITIDGVEMERVVFQLEPKVSPLMTAKFIEMCTSKTSYQGSRIFKVIWKCFVGYYSTCLPMFISKFYYYSYCVPGNQRRIGLGHLALVLHAGRKAGFVYCRYVRY